MASLGHNFQVMHSSKRLDLLFAVHDVTAWVGRPASGDDHGRWCLNASLHFERLRARWSTLEGSRTVTSNSHLPVWLNFHWSPFVLLILTKSLKFEFHSLRADLEHCLTWVSYPHVLISRSTRLFEAEPLSLEQSPWSRPFLWSGTGWFYYSFLQMVRFTLLVVAWLCGQVWTLNFLFAR